MSAPPIEPEIQFRARFGREPEVLTTAPGRVNLIGEHIDYLGGKVLPVAIDRTVTVCAANIDAPLLRVFSDRTGAGLVELPMAELVPQSGERSWLNYIIGVVAKYAERGITIPGFEISISSTLPAGAGLSSSAALETASALAIESLTATSLTVTERAQLCQAAEHDFAGVPCGIMDQLAVGACRRGHALLLDCHDLSMQYVPLPPATVLVVADTGVHHALADGEYQKRREQCEEITRRLRLPNLRQLTTPQLDSAHAKLGPLLSRRARHITSEMHRATALAEALANAEAFANTNEPTIGRLMRDSHASLRDDYQVSCAELDTLVDAAYALGPAAGLIGSRMTGGGFGGSTVSLVRETHAARFAEQLGERFATRFARRPEIFITKAADGACPPNI